MKSYQLSQIRLIEVQLLKGCLRSYTLDETDIDELQNVLIRGITSIELASRGKKGKDLELRWCEPTRYAEQCETCSFRGPCWQEMEHESTQVADEESFEEQS